MDEKYDFDMSNLWELKRSFEKETDRGCALIAAAYLDARLEELLKERFINDPNVFKNMFEGYGPLNSFGAKINISYLLDLISKEFKNDLLLVKKIRNKFAHKSSYLSFFEEEIISICSNFCIIENDYDENTNCRELFIYLIHGLLGAIDGQLNRLKKDKKDNIEAETKSRSTRQGQV